MSNKHYVKFNKKHLMTVVLLIALTVVLIAAFVFIQKLEFRLSDTGEEDVFVLGSKNPELDYNGKTYRYNENVESIVVMGLDSFEDEVKYNSYNNTERADFILVLALNNENKTCRALQIDRDTMSNNRVLGVTGEVVEYRPEQIALSHTYGTGGNDSARNTVDAVSNLMYGMEIDHYMTFTMDAVSEYNDLLGGVTISKGEIGSDGKKLSEDITLTGEDALNYVRARRGLDDPTNISRMERQRNYLKHLKNKTDEVMQDNESFILNAISEVNEYMTSDLTINELSKISEGVLKYSDGNVLSPKGESVDGELYKEFYLDREDFKKLVIEMFYEEE